MISKLSEGVYKMYCKLVPFKLYFEGAGPPISGTNKYSALI